MSRRYPALRIVSVILKMSAIVWVVIGVVSVIVLAGAGSNSRFGSIGLNGVQGFFVLLLCLYLAMMAWAGAELLQVFLDIEENTRRLATR